MYVCDNVVVVLCTCNDDNVGGIIMLSVLRVCLCIGVVQCS